MDQLVSLAVKKPFFKTPLNLVSGMIFCIYATIAMHCSTIPVKCVIIYCVPLNTFLSHRHLFSLVLLSIETEREERKGRIGWLAENFDAGEPLAVFLHLQEEQDQLRGARRERAEC